MSRRFSRYLLSTATRWPLLLLALTIHADPVTGQTGADTARIGAVQAVRIGAGQAAQSDEGFSIWGRSPDRRRFIAGIWALHPFEPNFPEVEYTDGFGVQFGMIYAGTFINSYGDRAWIGGVERAWGETQRGAVAAGLGYRVGVVTGYDERLTAWAGHTPAMPFVGLLAWLELGPVAADAFYVYRAITLEASLGF